MPFHPSLTRPHSPVLHRPDGTLQIGVGPSALHLHSVTTTEARWLATLDGTRPLEAVLTEGAAHGVPGERAAELVDRLAAVGHLQLSAPGARPLPGRVAVVGRGALAALLADVLAQAGTEQVARWRRDPGPPEEPGPIDLLLLITSVPPPAPEMTAWARLSPAVLPITADAAHASIGPLLAAGGPCAGCLEITRRAHDPFWPWLRAQLDRPRLGAEVPVDARPPVRLLAAGLATSLIADYLSGAPTEPGWAYDVVLPGPAMERRRWSAHPDCPECRAGAPTTALDLDGFGDSLGGDLNPGLGLDGANDDADGWARAG